MDKFVPSWKVKSNTNMLALIKINYFFKSYKIRLDLLYEHNFGWEYLHNPFFNTNKTIRDKE